MGHQLHNPVWRHYPRDMAPLHLARAALDRGEAPFLHVFADKPAATLYARLGFRHRAKLWVLSHPPIPNQSAA